MTLRPDLTGRVAIVTGTAQGIGSGIAAALESAGATVHGCDRDTVDVTDAEQVDAFVSAIGAVDILVNNAGGGVIRPTLEHTEETLRVTMDRNLWTMIYCTLEILPHMMERRYGRVVSTGAESVRNGLWQHAVYSAAKGGVHGFNAGLAREYAPYEITFNVVAPAMVITPQLKALKETWSLEVRERQDAFEEQIRQTIPLGRGGTVEEVAATTAFLASDEASYITGQVVSVNGGSSML